jgi:hypothetical protein
VIVDRICRWRQLVACSEVQKFRKYVLKSPYLLPYVLKFRK